MTRMRCAIYTRKSTEEGLDQSFNSLDAQREACEAYIRSQRQEGWKYLPEHYDDGGVSGGTMDRPALQRLLDEIDAGRIDMVVVYKIDRLTRSLADFAMLVERLDKAGASFVSVTQQFNTSTSMGRLTLNVLLSFAQFEREVTAERIRDKIAASKKKGMWMGGLVPLGYDKGDDGLVINSGEAETVRTLFRKYLDLGCVRRLKAFADEGQLRSKTRTRQDGTVVPGKSFSRGQLYHLLSNPIYRGKIRHRQVVHDGLHEAIVGERLWERVQIRMAENRRARATRTNVKSRSPLAGKLFDPEGAPLTPSHASKNGRRYRYYVSKRLIVDSGEQKSGWRLPASEIERTIVQAARRDREMQLAWTGKQRVDLSADDVLEQISKVQIKDAYLTVDLIVSNETEPRTISIPFTLRQRGVETRLVLQSGYERAPDLVLAKRVLRAMAWIDQIKSGCSTFEIAKAEGISPEYISHNLHFGLLSCRVLEAVISGELPPHISAQAIVRMQQLPVGWKEQENLLLS